MSYTLVRKPGEGLAVILRNERGKSDQALWARCKLRTCRTCVVTGRKLEPGEGEHYHKPNHAAVPAGGEIRCHSYLRAGVWEFLADCTHTMAGQQVPMVDLPDWIAGDRT